MNGTAAEAVGEQAEHGRKEELHQGEGGDKEAEVFRGARNVAAQEIGNQLGQGWHRDAKGQHVQQNGHEDKPEGGVTFISHESSLLSKELHAGESCSGPRAKARLRDRRVRGRARRSSRA